jgi:hypothetical protein
MTAQPRMSVARPKAFATRSRTATSISRSVVSEASTLPVHRRARHQQGACRPAGARVLRLRPASRPVRRRSGRSGREDVSRHRAERRLRLLGRFGRQLTTRGKGLSRSPPITTV